MFYHSKDFTLRFWDTNYTKVLKYKTFFFSCSCHNCPKLKPKRYPVTVPLTPFPIAVHKITNTIHITTKRKPKTQNFNLITKFKVVKSLKLKVVSNSSPSCPVIYIATQRLCLSTLSPSSQMDEL